MKYIFQTWKSHDLTSANPIFELSRASWQKMHPEWEYDFFDDAEIDLFVKAHFPKFYRYYFSRYIGQIKRVDLFRYCNLFIKGGIYSDLDGECIKPFDQLLSTEPAHHTIGSLKSTSSPNRFPNALMVSRKPLSTFWLFVLAHAGKRFEENKGFYSTEYLTGPILLTDAILDYEKKSFPEIDDFIKQYSPDYTELRALCKKWEKEHIQIVPHCVFYPIDWHGFSKEQRYEIIEDRIKKNQIPSNLIEEDSFTLNYWTHSWEIPQYSTTSRVWLRFRFYGFKILRALKLRNYRN